MTEKHPKESADERRRKAADLSRRQFLVRSAGIAGASIGLGVPGRGARGDAELRLGVAGAGERGVQLLSAALECPGIRIAAVVDVAPAARRRAREIVARQAPSDQPCIAAELDGLLEAADRGKLDAVFIATPSFHHRTQAVQCLRAGLHVYLEKPMGLSIAECDEVRAEARHAESRGQVFQIGLQRRYNPRYVAGLEAIRSGRAGRPLFIRAQWHTLGNAARLKAWYYRRERSGDLVLEHGCHQMDVFNWVFDAHPVRATGFGGADFFGDDPPGRTVRDHYGLTLEYPRGGKVHSSHVSFAIPDRRFSGVYELVFCEELGIDLWNGLAWDRGGKTVAFDAPGGSDTPLAVQAFLTHIRGGERSTAGPEVGYLATAASLLGLEALDSGRVALWDELIG